MPIYLDRHEGVPTAQDVAEAHRKDVEIQESYGVKYLTYWFDYDSQKAWCMVDAPSPEIATEVHREAHGLISNRIISVDPSEIHKFLGGIGVDESPEFPEEGMEANTVRTILFTDMVGSTEVTHRLGDDAAMDMLRAHNRIVREALDLSGGREIKHTGDGIMACFESVSKAIECAITVQQALDEHNRGANGAPVNVRIGMAAGEPITEDNDLYGTAVNLAARICDAADSGSVLVSNVVKDLAIGKSFEFEPAMTLELKGFPDPVAVARVVFA